MTIQTFAVFAVMLASTRLVAQTAVLELSDPHGDLAGTKLFLDNTDLTQSLPGQFSFEKRHVISGPLELRKDNRVIDSRQLCLRAGWNVTLPALNFTKGRPELVAHSSHSDSIWAIAASADGKRILSGGADRVAIVWDAVTGKQLRTLSGAKNMVMAVALDPKGEIAALGIGRHALFIDKIGAGVRIHEVETGKLLHETPSDPVTVIALLPGGQSVWFGTEKGDVFQWDFKSEVDARRKPERIKALTAKVTVLTIDAASGQKYAGDADGNLWQWLPNANTPQLVFKGNGNVTSCALTPDGKQILVTWSHERDAHLFDVGTRKIVRTIRSDGQGFIGADLSKDGKQALFAVWLQKGKTETEYGVCLYDLDKGTKLRYLTADKNIVHVAKLFPRPDGEPGSLAYVATDISDTLRTKLIGYDTANGKLGPTFGSNFDRVWTVAFRPDGAVFLTSTGEGQLCRWNPTEDPPFKCFSAHKKIIRSIHYRADGKQFATGSDDGTMALWDDATLKLIRRFEGIGANANTIKLNPNGTRLLVALRAERNPDNTIKSGGHVALYDTATGDRLAVNRDFTTSVWDADFSPDGRQIAIGDGERENDKEIPGKVYLLDTETLKPIATFPAHKKMISCVVFSPDSKEVASSSFDGSVKIWSVGERKLLKEMPSIDQIINCLQWTPDGKCLYITDAENTIRFLNRDTMKTVSTMKGHTGPVDQVVIRPGTLGRNLLSIGGDAVIRYWDAATSDQVAWLTTLNGGNDWLAATPLGQFDGTQAGRDAIGFRMDGKLTVALADRFYRDYRKDNLLKTIWDGKIETPAKKLNDTLPPLVQFLTPKPNGPLPKDEFEFEIEVTDRGTGIEYARVRLGGRPAQIKQVGMPRIEPLKEFRKYRVQLQKGENRLTAHAQGLTPGSQESEPVVFAFPYSGTNHVERLHIVAIGVNNYTNAAALKFPEVDATAIAKVFSDKRHVGFTDVKTTVLLGPDANRNKVIQTLTDLKTDSNDTTLVFFSGHGYTQDDYYFLPCDGQPNDLIKTAVSGTEIFKALGDLKGRNVIVVLDTCESMGIGKAVGRFHDHNNREQNTSVIFAASGEAKEAIALGHGVLTYSMLYNAGTIPSLVDMKLPDPPRDIVTIDLFSYHVKLVANQIIKKQSTLEGGVNTISGKDYPLLDLK